MNNFIVIIFAIDLSLQYTDIKGNEVSKIAANVFLQIFCTVNSLRWNKFKKFTCGNEYLIPHSDACSLLA
jgi:hypothetical protein